MPTRLSYHLSPIKTVSKLSKTVGPATKAVPGYTKVKVGDGGEFEVDGAENKMAKFKIMIFS